MQQSEQSDIHVQLLVWICGFKNDEFLKYYMELGYLLLSIFYGNANNFCNNMISRDIR